MITVNWQAVLLGFSFGLPISALFFIGLAWGMRQALASERPGLWLMASSFCRIAVLLGIGAGGTAYAGSNWAIAGYALAFFLTHWWLYSGPEPARHPQPHHRRARNAAYPR